MNASDFSFLFLVQSKNALSSKDTVEFFACGSLCGTEPKWKCSNQRLPYLQDLSTINSQELIMVDEDGQNKSRHQC